MVKTTIMKAFKAEIAMIPALIMTVYQAFIRAYWDCYEFYTEEMLASFSGGDVLDSFFGTALEYMQQSIPLLACMAVIIAVIAMIIALRKNKVN